MNVHVTTRRSTEVPGLEAWTWGALEVVLRSLAANKDSRAMVSNLVDAARLQSPFLPVETVRREIALIFVAIVDPSFPAEALTMT